MMSESIEDYRRISYETSQATAPGWDRWRAHLEAAVAPVRAWMVGAVDSQPGDTVLELAAGAGDTGFEIAAMIGEGGRLLSTDFSPAMVEVARRRCVELGLTNVDTRIMDAEKLDFAADSVDVVLCRFGYMLMADPAAALAETRRVLRPGGRVALAVWGAPDRNPFFSVIAGTLGQRGHLPPSRDGAPSPFSMASPDHTRGLLRAGGFDDVTSEELPLTFAYRDLDEYLDFMTDIAGPVAVALRRLSDHERGVVAALVGQAIAPFLTDDGYRFPGLALVATAT